MSNDVDDPGLERAADKAFNEHIRRTDEIIEGDISKAVVEPVFTGPTVLYIDVGKHYEYQAQQLEEVLALGHEKFDLEPIHAINPAWLMKVLDTNKNYEKVKFILVNTGHVGDYRYMFDHLKSKYPSIPIIGIPSTYESGRKIKTRIDLEDSFHQTFTGEFGPKQVNEIIQKYCH